MIALQPDALRPCPKCGERPIEAPGAWRCAECRRAYDRAMYRKRRARTRAAAGDGLAELGLAVGMMGAYMSGYRAGVGDRAAQLLGPRQVARQVYRIDELTVGTR